MKKYSFSMVIERDPDGYFAFCPALRGATPKGRPTRRHWRISRILCSSM